GALDPRCDGRADQVHRRGRAAGGAGGVRPGPDARPDPPARGRGGVGGACAAGVRAGAGGAAGAEARADGEVRPERLPRGDAAVAEAGAARGPAEDDPGREPQAAEEREGRPQADEAPGGDHPLDDAAGAGAPGDPERLAPCPHRAWIRPADPGGEPAPGAVQAGPEAHEADAGAGDGARPPADAVQPLRLSRIVPRPRETEANARTYPTPASGPEEAAELPHRGGRFKEPAGWRLRGIARLLQSAAAAGRAAPRPGEGGLLA